MNQEQVSVKEWVLTLILMMIPLVNLIMLFIWAFGDNTKVSKQNFAKAQLLLVCIVFIFYFLLFLIIL